MSESEIDTADADLTEQTDAELIDEVRWIADHLSRYPLMSACLYRAAQRLEARSEISEATVEKAPEGGVMKINEAMLERAAKVLDEMLPTDASQLRQQDIIRIARAVLEAALSEKDE